jgi:hypothetical protein
MLLVILCYVYFIEHVICYYSFSKVLNIRVVLYDISVYIELN